jgi:YVTN family beta-propeller protein
MPRSRRCRNGWAEKAGPAGLFPPSQALSIVERRFRGRLRSAASVGAVVLPALTLVFSHRSRAARLFAPIRWAPIRRAPIRLAAILLGWATVPALATNAVILNSNDDSLSVIDTATYKEISRTYIGRAPHHLMMTPDGKTLIVAMAGGDELVFIDRATGVFKQRIAASDPYQVGFSPDAKWFVATSLRLDRIDIYDAANYRLVHRLLAPTMPSHIAFSPDSTTDYITLQRANNLIAIDLAAGKPLWTVAVGPQPAGVWVRPSGTILVAIMGSDHIAEIAAGDGSVIRRIQTGRGAHNFLLSPDGKVLYVSNRVAGTISVLDADTLAVIGAMPAPGGPDDMALTPDGREL